MLNPMRDENPRYNPGGGRRDAQTVQLYPQISAMDQRIENGPNTSNHREQLTEPRGFEIRRKKVRFLVLKLCFLSRVSSILQYLFVLQPSIFSGTFFRTFPWCLSFLFFLFTSVIVINGVNCSLSPPVDFCSRVAVSAVVVRASNHGHFVLCSSQEEHISTEFA